MNWLSFGAGALFIAAIAFSLHTLDVNRIEKNHKNEMQSQQTLLEGNCQLAKNITSGVSNGLQINLSDLDTDFDNLNQRLQCYGTQADAAGLVPFAAAGHDGSTTGKEFTQRVGRTFNPVRVIAITKKGERYRVQLKACQAWAAAAEQAAKNNFTN